MTILFGIDPQVPDLLYTPPHLVLLKAFREAFVRRDGVRRLRAWFAAMHSGRIEAPPGPLYESLSGAA